MQTWQRLIRHTERVGSWMHTKYYLDIVDDDDDEERNTPAGAA